MNVVAVTLVDVVVLVVVTVFVPVVELSVAIDMVTVEVTTGAEVL